MSTLTRWAIMAVLVHLGTGCAFFFPGEDEYLGSTADTVDSVDASTLPEDSPDSGPPGDDPEDLWQWNPDSGKVVCTQSGLILDGMVVVPSNPLVEAWIGCGSVMLHVQGSGYEACCDQHCCSWAPDSGSQPLAGLGESCAKDGPDCVAGLMCKDSGAAGWLCSHAGPGDPCASGTDCAPGLYCDSNGVCAAQYCDSDGACAPRIEEEGKGCVQGPEEPCAWPLRCVCPLSLLCACYDGSVGDPCTSDSCATGNYCNLNSGWESTSTCLDGKEKDPCSQDWQCNEGLTCVAIGGPLMCAAVLPPGAPCGPGAAEQGACGPGFSCNLALAEPACVALGVDGDVCAADSDCAGEGRCVEAAGVCSSGHPGDACETESDCKTGSVCWGDGEKQCAMTLAPGAPCDVAGGVSSTCAPDTSCNHAYAPPSCMPRGGDGTPCTLDSDCSVGASCVEDLGLCFDGNNPDPCDASGCASGFSCLPGLALCSDGAPAAACLSDADCQPGLLCVGLWDTPVCLVVLKVGQPCSADAAPDAICPAGTVCDDTLEVPVCMPQGGLGAPCANDQQCAGTLVCVDPPGVCAEGKGGDMCADDGDCFEPWFCNADAGVCVMGTAGDPCGPSSPCGAGYACDPDLAVCVGAQEGMPCASDMDCAEGLFCMEWLEECRDGSPGDPCKDAADCLSADCAQEVCK